MIAFVLGGGGARGALQVGALRALGEAGVHPDLLVGTSVGAVNAAFIAFRGCESDSLDGLARAWNDAATADLLPASRLRLLTSALFRQTGGQSYQRMRDFLIAHGLTPELRFSDARIGRLIVVATDLNAGVPVLYGQDLKDQVLDAVLASVALPPWILPIEREGRLLMDGGVVSCLPIEAALEQGATEIIALDLTDPRGIPIGTRGLLSFLLRLTSTVQQRQREMELAAAAARGVPVHRITLCGEFVVPIWDFRSSSQLIGQGYALTQREIAKWTAAGSRPKRSRLPRFTQPNWLARWPGFQGKLRSRTLRLRDLTYPIPGKPIHQPRP